MNYQLKLKQLKAEKDFFVGIDSDGCVFDTMELKQKEFFIPTGIKHFGLIPISAAVRETWEFVNLYSKYRGVNRFVALIQVFEFLELRKDIASFSNTLPDFSSLRKWVDSESKLGNQTLKEHIELNPDDFLSCVLNWSLTINEDIAQWIKGVAPFNHSGESLELISSMADSIVVSQTPLEALEREWKEHNIEKFVNLIAAQEHGTKTEHIALAAKGTYKDENILMIGDAPGDLKAARDNNICFYPIIPGKENKSWELFYTEAFNRFINHNYKGAYESEQLNEFDKALPSIPPWEQV